ncbi:MAG: hypothetical protein JHC26_01840 [Thermofilum sp.]|uniref:hypothetical protein n=1 Tax=Thermofilum sp. TaxID=1961369 RepID=UPI00258530CC|nr:hypothetical protein [Thermofilum sp.]MCI4407804.1 hypothetical protein [Thermofilum sp.]
MKKISEMSDKELISYAIQLHDVIFVVECYGLKDLYDYAVVMKELIRRGYKIQEVQKPGKLVIKKSNFSSSL